MLVRRAVRARAGETPGRSHCMHVACHSWLLLRRMDVTAPVQRVEQLLRQTAIVDSRSTPVLHGVFADVMRTLWVIAFCYFSVRFVIFCTRVCDRVIWLGKGADHCVVAVQLALQLIQTFWKIKKACMPQVSILLALHDVWCLGLIEWHKRHT